MPTTPDNPMPETFHDWSKTYCSVCGTCIMLSPQNTQQVEGRTYGEVFRSFNEVKPRSVIVSMYDYIIVTNDELDRGACTQEKLEQVLDHKMDLVKQAMVRRWQNHQGHHDHQS